MAKQKQPKKYEALINAKIGSNPDGSCRLHFQAGHKIELTTKQATYYKQIKYIK